MILDICTQQQRIGTLLAIYEFGEGCFDKNYGGHCLRFVTLVHGQNLPGSTRCCFLPKTWRVDSGKVCQSCFLTKMIGPNLPGCARCCFLSKTSRVDPGKFCLSCFLTEMVGQNLPGSTQCCYIPKTWRLEPGRSCDVAFWRKTWAQNLRYQGLRFKSLQQKKTPQSQGIGLAIWLVGGRIKPKILGTRACDLTLCSKKPAIIMQKFNYLETTGS